MYAVAVGADRRPALNVRSWVIEQRGRRGKKHKSRAASAWDADIPSRLRGRSCILVRRARWTDAWRHSHTDCGPTRISFLFRRGKPSIPGWPALAAAPWPATEHRLAL